MVKKVLFNLKWWLLPVTIIVFTLFIEAGTDSYGIESDEEGIMYTAWFLLIANACLFGFNKKWQRFINQWL